LLNMKYGTNQSLESSGMVEVVAGQLLAVEMSSSALAPHWHSLQRHDHGTSSGSTNPCVTE
jgi:hypothetical protein